MSNHPSYPSYPPPSAGGHMPQNRNGSGSPQHQGYPYPYAYPPQSKPHVADSTGHMYPNINKNQQHHRGPPPVIPPQTAERKNVTNGGSTGIDTDSIAAALPPAGYHPPPPHHHHHHHHHQTAPKAETPWNDVKNKITSKIWFREKGFSRDLHNRSEKEIILTIGPDARDSIIEEAKRVRCDAEWDPSKNYEDHVIIDEIRIVDSMNSLHHDVGVNLNPTIWQRHGSTIDAESGRSFLTIIPAGTQPGRSGASTVYKVNKRINDKLINRYGDTSVNQLRKDVAMSNGDYYLIKANSKIVEGAVDNYKGNEDTGLEFDDEGRPLKVLECVKLKRAFVENFIQQFTEQIEHVSNPISINNLFVVLSNTNYNDMGDIIGTRFDNDENTGGYDGKATKIPTGTYYTVGVMIEFSYYIAM